MKTRRKNSGNALAEIAILMPLYVLFILGIMYIGDLTGIRTLLHPVAEEAANHPDAGVLDLERRITAAYPEGNLEVRMPETGEEYPTAEQLDRFTQSHTSYSAHGTYVLRNGQLEEVVSVRRRVRPPMLGEDLLPVLEELWNGRLYHLTATAEFSYEPEYLKPAGIPLLGRSFEASHTTLTRVGAARNVESDGTSHPIDEIILLLENGRPLQHYPDFMRYNRDLWLPDMGRNAP